MTKDESFTAQSWCEECTTNGCAGEHAGIPRFIPATGGAARDLFLSGPNGGLEVPRASVTPMFFEDKLFPKGADDAPFLALAVTDGEISLRPHEARQLAAQLTTEADRIDRQQGKD